MPCVLLSFLEFNQELYDALKPTWNEATLKRRRVDEDVDGLSDEVGAVASCGPTLPSARTRARLSL